MYQLVGTPKTVLATPKLAKRFAEMTPAPHDRVVRDKRIAVYQKMWEQGQFRPVTWAEAYCAETGETYRVNGKHTSLMLHRSEKWPADFFVTVEQYNCDSLEDIGRLYATFDSKLASRTTHDINRAFAATVPEFADISDKVIGLAVHGICYYSKTDGYSTTPAPERAEEMLSNKPFVLWLNDILGKTPKVARLTRGAVVAAMFGSYMKNQSQATEFWTAVRDETGTKPNMPDRRLSTFLREKSVSFGAGARMPASMKVSAREVFVKAIHAWNAWRKNETTDLKYHAACKIPAMK